MSTDPFGRAIWDHHRGERTEPLVQRDGPDTADHPIEEFYFEPFTADTEAERWLASWVDGPLLDVGAGAGRHTLYFQKRFEAVAIEVSDYLVETMRDRGVAEARYGDMFSLREQFDPDRFQSALSRGTQLGLAGSMHGLVKFLEDLDAVTTADATAVLDCYDPDCEATAELLGYRDDPTPGLAYRVMHFKYEGEVGETLLFRLFGPNRVKEATAETDWRVADVIRPHEERDSHYRVALSKR